VVSGSAGRENAEKVIAVAMHMVDLSAFSSTYAE
jgi:hypothetical protein